MQHPKTTIWGIIAAIGIVCNAAVSIHNGHPFDAGIITQLLGALGVAAVGISAADGSNVPPKK